MLCFLYLKLIIFCEHRLSKLSPDPLRVAVLTINPANGCTQATNCVINLEAATKRQTLDLDNGDRIEQ